MKEDLETLFNKKFAFEKENDWVLPPINVLCKEMLWNIPCLQDLKIKLNNTKSLLNDKGESWHKHTRNINIAGLIQNHIKKFLNPEIVTNAWCKFYEILATFSCVPTDVELFRSLHLCEAPGAFISALNYFLCLNYPKIEFEWFANTLNPYYEDHAHKTCVTDDRLIFRTLEHWIFGEDNTGNITSDNLIKEISKTLKSKGPVHLVTADGSINCIDNPGEQELIVSDLHFSEVLICLKTLAVGGSFIFKKFTCFECSSACVLYLLNCLFVKVHIFKPVTSRSGNSEVYVICLNFQGIDPVYLDSLQKSRDLKKFSLFPKSIIPSSFFVQLEKCSTFFVDHQLSSITNNLELFSSMTHEQRQKIDELRDTCVSQYFERYSLEPLSSEQYYRLCCPNKILRTANFMNFGNKGIFTDKSLNLTFESIEHRKNLSEDKLLEELENLLNKHFPLPIKRSNDDYQNLIPIWKEIRSISKKNDFSNWITVGQSIRSVKCSKFINPVILNLLNDAILDMKISANNHAITSPTCWNWNNLQYVTYNNQHFLYEKCILHIGTNKCNSILAERLGSMMPSDTRAYNCDIDSVFDDELLKNRKLIVIHPSTWGPPAFEEELLHREKFVKVLLCLLKVLRSGDSVVLHIQSLVTRFQVGLLFIILSLFNKVITLLPELNAPALCGQMWILSDCINEHSIPYIYSYLETAVLNKEVAKNFSVLEVVPITTLCSGQFYDYLLDLNNRYTLQKLRRIVAVEKLHRKK